MTATIDELKQDDSDGGESLLDRLSRPVRARRGAWLPAPIDACFFSFYKGMWLTAPDRWTPRHIAWITIAFPWPTTLERGVYS